MVDSRPTASKALSARPWYRWVVYAVANLAFNFGAMLSDIGIAIPDIMRDLSIEAEQIGVIIGVYSYTYAFMQIPGGILADRVGPRRTMSAFLFVGGGGIIFFSRAPEFDVSIAARVVTALGVSVLYVNQIKVLRGWFKPDEFATAMGIGSAINAAGGLALRPLLAVVVESVGWRSTFASLGMVNLLFALLCWIVIRDRNPQWEQASEQEDGEPQMGVLQSIKTVFGNRQFLFLFFITALAFGGLRGIFWGWGLPLMMQGFSLPRVSAALMIMLVSLFGLVGSPLWGRLSDKKIRARKPILLMGLVCSTITILPFVFWAPQLKVPHLLVILPLMGATGGGLLLSYTMVNELVPASIAGVAAAGLNMGPYLGRGLFQPLAGYILGSPASYGVDGTPLYTLSDYQSIFLPALISGIAAILLLSRVRETMKPVPDAEMATAGK